MFCIEIPYDVLRTSFALVLCFNVVCLQLSRNKKAVQQNLHGLTTATVFLLFEFAVACQCGLKAKAQCNKPTMESRLPVFWNDF